MMQFHIQAYRKSNAVFYNPCAEQTQRKSKWTAELGSCQVVLPADARSWHSDQLAEHICRLQTICQSLNFSLLNFHPFFLSLLYVLFSF